MTPPTPPPYPISDACRPDQILVPRTLLESLELYARRYSGCMNIHHPYEFRQKLLENIQSVEGLMLQPTAPEPVKEDKKFSSDPHDHGMIQTGTEGPFATFATPQAQGTPLYPNVTRESKLKSSRERAKKHRDERRQYDRDRDPIKKNARSMIRKRINRGKLKRGICEVCGNPKTDAHHDDYAKPLEVRWLCRFHHKQLHKKESQ